MPSPHHSRRRPGESGYFLLVFMAFMLALVPVTLVFTSWMKKHRKSSVQAVVYAEDQYMGRSATEEALRLIRAANYQWTEGDSQTFAVEVDSGVTVNVTYQSVGFP